MTSLNLNLISQFKPLISTSATHATEVLSHQPVTYLQKVTTYLRNHPAALAASLMGINVALIVAIDKVIQVSGTAFRSDFLKNAYPLHMLVKSVCLLGALSCFNSVMNLQIGKLYLVASVIFTIASQLLWQQGIKPLLQTYLTNKPHSSLPFKQETPQTPFINPIQAAAHSALNRIAPPQEEPCPIKTEEPAQSAAASPSPKDIPIAEENARMTAVDPSEKSLKKKVQKLMTELGQPVSPSKQEDDVQLDLLLARMKRLV